jgi:two-component system, chemotaxis family, response regulator Rcp1
VSKPDRPAEILLIEDNPGDVELIHEALYAGRIRHNVSVMRDGDAAIAFVRKDAGYESAPRPDLILLDLNLPTSDGFEVLREIKADPKLARIPVVVLTTSQADRDILKCYSLHANCYVRKPVDVDEFLRVVGCIGEFWLSVVQWPPQNPPAAANV